MYDLLAKDLLLARGVDERETTATILEKDKIDAETTQFWSRIKKN